MNRIVLFLVFSLCAHQVLTAQSMQNNGFENWSTSNLWNDPAGYSFTSNMQAYGQSGPNVTRSTQSHGGTYAAKLQTVGTGPTVTPGLLVIGTPGPGGVLNGMPYTGHPDSITGYAKYQVMTGDTAALILLFKQAGTTLGEVYRSITGNSLSYVRFSFPVTWLSNGNPDTLAVAFASSYGSNQQAGSYAYLDDLAFTGVSSGAQFPNGDFENWVSVGFEEADHWGSSNVLTALQNGSISVDKSTSVHSGNFAAHLTTRYSALAQQKMSFLLTGRLLDQGQVSGILAFAPILKLTGYYKYSPVGNDTGLAVVEFTHYNTGTGMNDSVAESGFRFTAASSYTYFEVPVSSFGTPAPDSMWVGFSASRMGGDSSLIHVGSQLWIDDVYFVYPSGIALPLNEFFSKSTAYPNPSTGFFDIDLNILKPGPTLLHLYNSLGQEIKTISLGVLQEGVSHYGLDATNLASGVYFYGVENNGKNELHKITISRP